ncbi:MAG: hypothetical protein CL666_05715 [Balneola sp.]|nr:hypothetical protein [Balneola sp.]|tara:strand:+ start:186250 stop:186663 length:414 start_codon:yes stop_codon:yes gene_type:complete
MKTITIYRPEEHINKYADYNIIVDGEQVTTLKNGDSEQIEVDESSKQLSAKLMWCSSRKIDLKTMKDNIQIEIKPNKFYNSKLPLLTCLIPLLAIFMFENSLLSTIMTGLLGSLVLFILWTLTFGKDRWLELHPITE